MEISEQEVMQKSAEAAKTATDPFEQLRLECLASKGFDGFTGLVR